VRALLIVGTRPEAIKLAPVMRQMRDSDEFDPVLVSTGQHREMLDQMWDVLDVRPDVDVAIMRERQSLPALTARLVEALSAEIGAAQPDVVIVQGDTTSAMAAAMASFYDHVPVAHVEAGLRSGRMDNPFPEELNRKIVATIARWHFAPTALAAGNLRREGVHPATIVVTGNTVIDNLLWMRMRGTGASSFRTDLKRVLVTMHRRESQGVVMQRVAASLVRLAERGDVEIVLPMHKSPAVRDSLAPVLAGQRNVRLLEPLDYQDFVSTMAASDVILTDSGGIQEEAPSLGKPVLVLRETTERPEAIDAGTARLVGTDPDVVFRESARLLDDPAAYAAMAQAANPIGDGAAAERILRHLAQDLRPDSAQRLERSSA
jgi:UDP-N-acetylglucosamine 2-epimerase (non-hydrolysing)